jgi:hypothetical protein
VNLRTRRASIDRHRDSVAGLELRTEVADLLARGLGIHPMVAARLCARESLVISQMHARGFAPAEIARALAGTCPRCHGERIDPDRNPAPCSRCDGHGRAGARRTR